MFPVPGRRLQPRPCTVRMYPAMLGLYANLCTSRSNSPINLAAKINTGDLVHNLETHRTWAKSQWSQFLHKTFGWQSPLRYRLHSITLCYICVEVTVMDMIFTASNLSRSLPAFPETSACHSAAVPECFAKKVAAEAVGRMAGYHQLAPATASHHPPQHSFHQQLP